MLKTNVESLVRMKLREEVIHPELWVERGYATTLDGRPKLTVGIGGARESLKSGRFQRRLVQRLGHLEVRDGHPDT